MKMAHDDNRANRVIGFIQCLRHTKGEFHGKPFTLLPWQEKIVRDVFGTVRDENPDMRQYSQVYIEIGKKNGKQLSLDTPIPTIDGWKDMGTLQVGDSVFDETGQPCRVIGLSEVDDTEQCYRITFRDGSHIDAGERHQWSVRTVISGGSSELLTTGKMYQKAFRHQKDRAETANENGLVFHIPVTKALYFPNRYLHIAPNMYDDLFGRHEQDGECFKEACSDYHYIQNIKPLPHPIPMRCIQVDSPSRLYLAGPSFVPTHNSELGAALALNMLVNDDEQKAEVYSCASDRQQAGIVFDVAADMVRQSPALRRRIKIIPSTKRMVYQPTGSIYQVLSSEVATKHGLNVSACIFDELHTQPTRALYDVMTQGSGDARKQPLWIFLTTAGTDRNSICWEVHQKALDIIQGRKHDPRFYPVVFGLPDDADWTDEQNWYKANPSLDHTITIDKVRDAFHKAQETPADENMFRQLRLNQWVKQSIRWMPMDKWDACGGTVNPYELEGRICYAGMDLASTSDLTAVVLVFPPLDEEEPYMVLPFFWLPEETLSLRVRRDHVMYDQWERQGFLKTTEGNVVHYGFIQKFINDLSERYNIREIAYDRWNATMMVQQLEDDGFTMVPFGQGFKDMSPPTKELMRIVLEKKLNHGGHPVLRWNMDNTFVRTDPAGNLKIDKQKSTEKVDGAVALVMALDRAMKNQGGSGSVYDDRGLLWI